MAQVKFYTGTYETYKAAAKDPNALYFIADTLQLYKGTQLYTSNFKVVSNPPEDGEGIPGILYVSRNTHQLYIANEAGEVEALTPAITDVVKQNSKDLITAGGVYDAIEAIIKVADELEKTVNGYTDRISELEKVLGVDPDNPIEPDDPDNPDDPENPTPARPSVLDRIENVEKEVEDIKDQISKIDGFDFDDTNYIKKDAETGIVSGNIKVSGTPTEDNDLTTKAYVDGKVEEVTEVIGGLDPSTTDNIKELINWVKDPEGGQSALLDDIVDLKNNAVRKEDGKGLSSNDFTDEYKNKLDSIIIENGEGGVVIGGGGIAGVKVNGDALPIADDKTVELIIATGTGNGNILVNGKQVKVSGLKSAAYQEASDFATAEQGAKADTALQKSDITAGDSFGTLKIGDKEVTIPGLGTAAFKDSDDFIGANKLGDLGAYQTITEYASGVAEKAKEDAIQAAQEAINNVLSWESIA